MNHTWRARWAIVIVALLATVGLLPQLAAAQECADLPSSHLKVRRLSVDEVTEHAATPDEIDRVAAAFGDRRATHPLMLILNALETRAAAIHRVIQRGKSRYCDAPETVIIGFGVVRREVVIARDAEVDPCIRTALLAHEAEHDRMLGAAIQSFIQQRRSEIHDSFAVLKRIPALTRQSATQAFETGIATFLARMLKEFKEERLSRIKQTIDSAGRLAELSSACNGRLGELEKLSRKGGEVL